MQETADSLRYDAAPIFFVPCLNALHRKVLDDKKWQAFALAKQLLAQPVTVVRRTFHRIHEGLHIGRAEARKRERSSQTGLLGLLDDLAQPAAGVTVIVSPGCQDKHRPPAQAAHQVSQHVQARLVGPLQVVEEEDAGQVAVLVIDPCPEGLADALEELNLRAWVIQRRSRGQVGAARDQLRQEAARLGQPAVRCGCQPLR